MFGSDKKEYWVSIEYENDGSYPLRYVPAGRTITVQAKDAEEAKKIARSKYGHKKGFRITGVC